MVTKRDDEKTDLLGAGVFGDGLGALGHCVFGQLSGKKQTDGGLDFARSDGRLFVVLRQAGGLGGDPLEDVVDKRVHDGHSLGGDSGVGVDLLQHLVDVDRVGFLSATHQKSRKSKSAFEGTRKSKSATIK